MRRTAEDPGPASSGGPGHASIDPERRGERVGSIVTIAMHGTYPRRGRVITGTDPGSWKLSSSTSDSLRKTRLPSESRWNPNDSYSTTSARDKGRITQIVRTIVLECPCIPFMASSDSPFAADQGTPTLASRRHLIFYKTTDHLSIVILRLLQNMIFIIRAQILGINRRSDNFIISGGQLPIRVFAIPPTVIPEYLVF